MPECIMVEESSRMGATECNGCLARDIPLCSVRIRGLGISLCRDCQVGLEIIFGGWRFGQDA